MTKPKLALAVAAAFAAVLGQPSALGQTVLDTTSLWDGSFKLGDFGPGWISTYGQTFVAPSPVPQSQGLVSPTALLQNFTFFLEGAATLNYRAVVMQWEGPLRDGGPIGGAGLSLLWESPSQVYSSNDSNFHAVTTTTPGIAVAPGAQYVIALTISEPSDYAASFGEVVFGSLPGFEHAPASASGGGGFVEANNENYGVGSLTGGWYNYRDWGDLAFTASFGVAPVPEPGEWTMLSGLSLLAYAGLRRIRRVEH